MGKGSHRRPSRQTPEQEKENWDRIFGKKKKVKKSPRDAGQYASTFL
jgi:hypothetical protein